jgi:ferredoxin-NADP reductase
MTNQVITALPPIVAEIASVNVDNDDDRRETCGPRPSASQVRRRLRQHNLPDQLIQTNCFSVRRRQDGESG